MKKEINDWIEEDILNLIKSRMPESPTLEFKACDALRRMEKKDWRKEFAKDVSAFANSGGAIVIYGIVEDRDTHEAQMLDGGFDPHELDIETLEQIASSQIQRTVEGIKYKSIALSGDKQGRFVYVLDIPESDRAPHMANHRFYKRYHSISVYMDEHEVRERYRREKFPGKDVVEAWRDVAINPILSDLASEIRLLTNERWSWSHNQKTFNGFQVINDRSSFSANLEDFVSRHANVEILLEEHDSALESLNDSGLLLFKTVAESTFINELFTWTTSEVSLTKFIKESPRFTGRTPGQVRQELLGTEEQGKQVVFEIFSEWAINGAASPTANRDLFDFWRTYYQHFRNLVLFPPHLEYRLKVESARGKLLEVDERLVDTLKEIRKTLSERHNIPQEAPRSPEAYWSQNALRIGQSW